MGGAITVKMVAELEETLEQDLARIEAEQSGSSEEIYNICMYKDLNDKYNDTPEPEKVEQLQALVAQGQRLNDEQINKLKAISESHSDRSDREADAGDLNWSYESQADADRIVNYLKEYANAIAQVEGSEEIYNICMYKDLNDQYNDAPEPEKVEQLQALVAQGQR